MPEENITRIVQTYAQAWSELDKAAMRSLLEAAWGDDAQYTDPRTQVKGRIELWMHIEDFQHEWFYPRMELSSGVDTHHGMLRFR